MMYVSKYKSHSLRIALFNSMKKSNIAPISMGGNISGKSAANLSNSSLHLTYSAVPLCSQVSDHSLFLKFCRTWKKRYLITSQTRVKRVSQIHHRTILYLFPFQSLLRLTSFLSQNKNRRFLVSFCAFRFSGRLTSGAPIGRVALSKRQVFHFHWIFFFFASKATIKKMFSLGSLVVQVQSDREKQLFAFENCKTLPQFEDKLPC